MTTSSHSRLREAFFASVAYVVTTAVSVWLLRHPLADASLWLRLALCLLPVFPITLAVRAVVRMILAGDELQRRIDLEAIAVASVVVGLGTLTLGLVMTADMIDLSSQQAMLGVFPALWIGYCLAKLWAVRRYQ